MDYKEGIIKLTELHIEKIKAAAEKIGEFGKVILAVSGGVVDIITEDRVRIQNGNKDSALNENRLK